MSRRSKIDEGGGLDEVQRWYEREGRTFSWMQAEYLRKYDLQVSPTMFSERARTLGWKRRIVRDTDLIPWAVKLDHRWDNILTQLRMEARYRAGENPADWDHLIRAAWERFTAHLKETNSVVFYDPDTEQGFFFVPREPGDTDIVRQPPPNQRGRRSRN